VIGKNPAEVVQTGLAGTICKGLERGDTEAVNAANVDDARRVIRSSRLLQERSHKLGEIEDTVKVEGQDAGEGFGGILVVGGAPVGTGVVDQDIEL
jgi:hypothetical protein